MNKSIALLSICLFISISNIKLSAQNFGCYTVPSESSYIRNGSIIEGPSPDEFISGFLNDDFKILSDSTGYYQDFYFTLHPEVKKLKMEGNLIHGKRDGFWKFYLLDEDYYISGEFDNDKKVGEWCAYYILEKGDTIFKEIAEFENDSLNGEMKTFYDNERISRRYNYKNGLKHGELISYWFSDNSNLDIVYKKENYLDGIKNGEFVRFNSNSNRDTLEYTQYKNGKLNGRCYINHYHGGKTIINYQDGKIVDNILKYHANGKLHFEIEMKNNLPFNLICNNDSLGIPYDTCMFNYGSGVLNHYHINGQLKSSCYYKNQIPNGFFQEFYKDGTLKSKGRIECSNRFDDVCSRTFLGIDDFNNYSISQYRDVKFDDYYEFSADSTLQFKIYQEYIDSINSNARVFELYDYDGVISSRSYNVSKGNFRKYICYYSNNQIKSIKNYVIDSVYKNHRIDISYGLCTYYHDNGQLKVSTDFSANDTNKRICFYDETGSLIRVYVKNIDSEYNIFNGDTVNLIDSNGLKQGKWISFERDPWFVQNCYVEPNQIMYYEDGKPSGTWKTYFSSYFDEPVSYVNENWINENLIYCKYYYDGMLNFEGHRHKNRFDGEWKYYNVKNGCLTTSGCYFFGERHGPWKYYKRNGKVIRIEYYEFDKLVYISGKKLKEDIIKNPYSATSRTFEVE